ncbi:MAG: hypothetical protein O6952_00970 [Planctomycetota bacterium]|nr:hypothetical protein [Planctomycetota bacterium]
MEGQERKTTRGTRIVVGCGVALFILVAVCGTSGYFLVRWLMIEPEGIRIQVESPDSVTLGQEFTILLTVHNEAEREQLLHSIDLYDVYLDGIAIQGTKPEFTTSHHTPIFDIQTYEFQENIPAGDSIEVRFVAKAVKTGDFRADIDVCINSAFHFLSRPIRTRVVPE